MTDVWCGLAVTFISGRDRGVKVIRNIQTEQKKNKKTKTEQKQKG